jgi:hypothetical protein
MSDYMGFVVDKVALGQVFSEYFGFPCRSFQRLLHTCIIHHPSWYSWSNSGRRTKWTQSHNTKRKKEVAVNRVALKTEISVEMIGNGCLK